MLTPNTYSASQISSKIEKQAVSAYSIDIIITVMRFGNLVLTLTGEAERVEILSHLILLPFLKSQ